MTAVDLYAHYQHWCQKNRIRAFATQAVHQVAREEIEINLGLKYRHDLAGKQGASRGWKGLGLFQRAESGKCGNRSAQSEKVQTRDADRFAFAHGAYSAVQR